MIEYLLRILEEFYLIDAIDIYLSSPGSFSFYENIIKKYIYLDKKIFACLKFWRSLGVEVCKVADHGELGHDFCDVFFSPQQSV